jgi:hypothetical protein
LQASRAAKRFYLFYVLVSFLDVITNRCFPEGVLFSFVSALLSKLSLPGHNVQSLLALPCFIIHSGDIWRLPFAVPPYGSFLRKAAPLSLLAYVLFVIL